MKARYLAAAAVAAVFASAPSFAVALGTITAPTSVGIFSGNITTNGADTGTYTFTLTNTYALATGSLTNSASGGAGAYDFTSVTITGGTLLTPASYSIGARQGNGSMTAALGSTLLGAGSYTLTVNGNVSGAPSSYGGSLSFSQAPEPATWGLMLIGFGAIGGALRTSRRKVVFA